MGDRPKRREFDETTLLPRILDELGATSIFLVADRDAYRASGAEAALGAILARYRIVCFDSFEPNPKFPQVCEGAELLREHPCDVVVAVGGGTAIDVAKLVLCFAIQDASPPEIVNDNRRILSAGSLPLVAIPTTAGTGSEATHFAVVYLDGEKHSVAHPSLLPDYVCLDPRLTQSMPPRLTAETGLDALCQAIESIWSVGSTSLSIRYATEALDLTLNNLATAVQTPTPGVRAKMLQAANLAGKAINISKTTAPHAISYAMTTNHGVAHGHAVSLTVAPFLQFNAEVSESDVVDGRGVDDVRRRIDLIVQTVGCRDVSETAARITELMQSIGCQTQLSKLGIRTVTDRRAIARSANFDRLSNNPRTVTVDDLDRILDSIA